MSRSFDVPAVRSPWVELTKDLPDEVHVDLSAGSWSSATSSPPPASESALAQQVQENADLRLAVDFYRGQAQDAQLNADLARDAATASVELAEYYRVTAELHAANEGLGMAIMELSNVNNDAPDDAAAHRAEQLAQMERRYPSGRRQVTSSAAQADLSGPKPVRAQGWADAGPPDRNADWHQAMYGELPASDLSTPGTAEREQRLATLHRLYGGATTRSEVPASVTNLSEALPDQDLRRASAKSLSEQVDELVAKGQTRERAEWLVAARMQFGN